jgi:hypothetical protein
MKSTAFMQAHRSARLHMGTRLSEATSNGEGRMETMPIASLKGSIKQHSLLIINTTTNRILRLP